MSKPCIWTGVFDHKGRLVDVSEGEFTAAEHAEALTKQTKKPHTTASVEIRKIVHE